MSEESASECFIEQSMMRNASGVEKPPIESAETDTTASVNAHRVPEASCGRGPVSPSPFFRLELGKWVRQRVIPLVDLFRTKA